MAHEDALNLQLSCSNLPISCTGGVRIITMVNVDDDYGFVEIGQTETVCSEVNPSFERTVPIMFRMDLNQHLRFFLCSMDPTTDAILERLGQVDTSLLTLISASSAVALPFRPHSLRSWDPDNNPVLSLAVGVPDTSARGTRLQFVGTSLAARHGITANSYFTLSTISTNGSRPPVLLYRSEIAPGADPKWRPFTLPTKSFPTSADWLLEVACYSFHHNSEDKLLGKFTTTFFQLLSGHAANKYLLRGGDNREHASMELTMIESVEKIPSFVGLLQAGLQLHFTVAVDFTAKNGGQNDPNALHYVHPHQRSVYMDALSSVCSVISKFDKLGRISMLGFGAKVPPKFDVSHLFALNGSIDSPHVRGAEEALQTYRRMSMSVLPYAPTEYSNVIHHTIKLAKASVRSPRRFHFVLIVLTNGSLKDPRDTIDTIASELPVSVVFVALGNNQHPTCGGDQTRLLRLRDPSLKSANNMPLSREVVTVVEHVDGGEGSLPQKVLEAIPRQVTTWTLRNSAL